MNISVIKNVGFIKRANGKLFYFVSIWLRLRAKKSSERMNTLWQNCSWLYKWHGIPFDIANTNKKSYKQTAQICVFFPSSHYNIQFYFHSLSRSFWFCVVRVYIYYFILLIWIYLRTAKIKRQNRLWKSLVTFN